MAILNRFFNRVITSILMFGFKNAKYFGYLLLFIFIAMWIALAIGKAYQNWDKDPDRGAVEVTQGAFDEDYTTPVYVDQGWSRSDSLWFYNTTQGSNLMPYDIFVELEQAESTELFRSLKNIDYFRYLPQKPTFFNPDGLPVGIVRDGYDGKDYVGFTCAACHTGQVNFDGKAVRIDGGAAMADMDGFLTALADAMSATLKDSQKKDRLVKRVLKRNGFWRMVWGGRSYTSAEEVHDDLVTWTNRLSIYNTLNKSEVEYGYARLDAFGRIYNRVLKHVMDKKQVATKLAFVFYPNGQRVLTNGEIENVMEGLDGFILGQDGFEEIVKRLQSKEPGFPGLDGEGIALIGDSIFNKANAPVSYPFVWDVPQSDYVQWNGLAANEGVGPLGRNTGEVIGVFATLDWKKDETKWWEFWEGMQKFSLSAFVSGQSNKQEHIDFQSSINKVNLSRMESHMQYLTSPRWEDVKFADGTTLPAVNKEGKLWKRGEQLYLQYCVSCHELIDSRAWDRRIISHMTSTKKVGTDPTMAKNSVNYKGSSGNFQHIYQETAVGPVLVQEEAPAVQILTAATRGVIATPDHDKWLIRRWLDWVYTLGMSFFDNDIEPSIKAGDYEPDTTANPYASLDAYKARPLNGIWATAPYLHNGSVPTMYDLFLPKEERPSQFWVGCRELDAEKLGTKCEQGQGKLFDTTLKGNSNAGHEYAAGRTPLSGSDTPLPALNADDRKALVEFIKTL
jgi:mono/diheme cytochrome c family protein